MSVAFIDAAKRSAIPELTPQAEVAILSRALFRAGYDDGNIGHMTYRQPDDTFLVLPAELGWDEPRPEDILRIDIQGNVLEGIGTVPSPMKLHLEYHKLHQACTWTVHQHPQYATIWSALGRIPPVYAQRGASLGDDIGLYDDYPGSVEAVDAAKAAAAAVGEKKAVLLRNHGVFVVGDDVREAFSRAIALEYRARIAWHVEAVGNGREMPDYGQKALVELSKRAGQGHGSGLWEWSVRRELREDPTLLS